MRRWHFILIVMVLVGGFLVTSIASSLALNELASRPILALMRDDGGVRVPVQTAGQPVRLGEARILGGRGVPFGFSTGFGLPDGGTVTCTTRFRDLTCSDGWVAERAEL